MNKNINGSDLTFEQDNLISFDEATHTYSVDGKELTPVSNVVSQFFTPCDAERISIRKCHGDKNAARILAMNGLPPVRWQAKRVLSSTSR